MNIVTSICVDTESSHDRIKYPNLDVKDSAARRARYWQFVTTFCCSSVRCNPQLQHLVYTNDEEPVLDRGRDLREFLASIGVEIRHLPFETYVPPASSGTKFRNAYYKLDVLRALASLPADDGSLLVDSDCLWVRPNPAVKQEMESGKLLLYDVYERTDPFQREPKDMSRAEMGELYTQLDPGYPEKFPVWYGGEFVGGKHATLRKIIAELDDDFAMMVEKSREQQFVFRDGWNIFDGDEFQLSFVCNKGLVTNTDMRPYLKRIWSQEYLSNVQNEDVDLTIWHLPGEKERGLPLLFEEALNRQSAFWTTAVSDLPGFLGGYVGVPVRRIGEKASLRRRLHLFINFVKGIIRRQIVNARALFSSKTR